MTGATTENIQALPESPPADTTPLLSWIEFNSSVIPIPVAESPSSGTLVLQEIIQVDALFQLSEDYFPIPRVSSSSSIEAHTGSPYSFGIGPANNTSAFTYTRSPRASPTLLLQATPRSSPDLVGIGQFFLGEPLGEPLLRGKPRSRTALKSKNSMASKKRNALHKGVCLNGEDNSHTEKTST